MGPTATPGVSQFSAYQSRPGVYYAEVSATVPTPSVQWSYLRLVDLDKDGDLDLVSAPQDPSNAAVVWAKNDFNNGTFNPSWTVLVARGTNVSVDMEFGDFTRDNITDVVILWSDRNLFVYVGTGGGVFDQAAVNILAALPSANVGPDAVITAAADMDGDGDTDILMSNWCDPAFFFGGCRAIVLLRQLPLPRNFSAHLLYTTVSWYDQRVSNVMDVNNDGLLDFVGYEHQNPPSNNVLLYLGGSGGLAVFPQIVLQNMFYAKAVLGDLTGDSWPDLAIAYSSYVYLYFNSRLGGYLPQFSQGQSLTRMDIWEDFGHLDVVDCDGDGFLDLVGASTRSIEIFFFSSAVNRTSQRRLDIASAGLVSIQGPPVRGNLLGNARPEFVFVDSLISARVARVVALSTDVGLPTTVGPDSFGPAIDLLPNMTGNASLSHGFATGDFDWDGDTDALALASGGKLLLIRNLWAEGGAIRGAAIAFAAPRVLATVPALAYGASSWSVADLDSDGDLDAVMSASPQVGGSPLLAVAENRRIPSGFAAPWNLNAYLLPQTASVTGSVVATDMDLDGDLDILLLRADSAFPFGSPTVMVLLSLRVETASAALVWAPAAVNLTLWLGVAYGTLPLPFTAQSVTVAQMNPSVDSMPDLLIHTGSELCVALAITTAFSATNFGACHRYAVVSSQAGGLPASVPQLVIYPDNGPGAVDAIVAVGPIGPGHNDASTTKAVQRVLATPQTSAVFEYMSGVPVPPGSTPPVIDSAMADYDGDGDYDLAINDMFGSLAVNVDGVGRTIAISSPFQSPNATGIAAIAPPRDWTYDGYMDVVYISSGAGQLRMRVNQLAVPGNVVPFPGPSCEVLIDSGMAAMDVKDLLTVDVDLDGQLDLVTLFRGVAAVDQAIVFWPFNEATLSFGARRVVWTDTMSVCIGGGISLTSGSSSLRSGDLNNDTIPDWVISCRPLASAVIVLLGDKAATLGGNPSVLPSYVNLTIYVTPTGAPAIFDADGNGVLDIVVGLIGQFAAPATPRGGFMYWLGSPSRPGNFSNNAGMYVQVIPFGLLQPIRVISITPVDMNFDGRMDLLLGTATSVNIWFNNYTAGAEFTGLPIFTPAMVRNRQTSGTAFTIAKPNVVDLNGDGLLDIISPASSIVQTFRADNTWIPLPFAPAAYPRTKVVDVARCGYTLACILDAAASLGAGCPPSELPPGVFAPRRVLLPAGLYGVCFRAKPWRIPRDLIIEGTATGGGTIIRCDTRGTDGTTLGGYGFEVSGGVRFRLVNVTIESAFSGALTFGGGAVLALGAGTLVSLENVRFVNCSAKATALVSVESPNVGVGAAVLVRSGARVEVRNCTFFANSAAYGGGGIAVLGAGSSLYVADSRFDSNQAIVGGAAIFAELAVAGQMSLEITRTVFRDNAATADPSDPRIVSYGGAIAVQVYAGSTNVTVTQSVLERNSVAHNGGALSVLVGYSGAATVAFRSSTLQDNTAQLAGGAIAITATSQPVTWMSFDAVNVYRNAAATRFGGGLALLSAPASDIVTPQTNLVFGAGGARFVNNTAGTHGGALGLAVRQATSLLAPLPLTVATSAGANLVFARNTALGIGGALALLGRGTVDVSGARFDANQAVFGGAYAAFANPGTGLEAQAVSTVGQLPVAVPGAGCDGMGRILAEHTLYLNNLAMYGTLAAVCDGRVGLTMAAGEVALDPAVAQAAADAGSVTAGGVVYSCALSLATSQCCEPTSCDTKIMRCPWVGMLGQGTAAGVDAAATVLAQVVSGYGRVSASAPVDVVWQGALPTLMSSGLPFGTGAAVLAVSDGYGQAVIDPALVATMTVPAGSIAFTWGSTPSLPVTQPLLLFSDLSIAVLRLNTPQLPIQLVVTTALGTWPNAPAIAVPVTLDICQPGSGGAPIGDPAQPLLCALCDEGFYSNATTLSPCRACPASLIPTGIGAIACYECAANSGLASAYAGIPGVPPNCTCLPGYWTPLLVRNVPCQGCPVGGKCLGGTEAPYALPGFYPSDEPGVFLECPVPSACLGGAVFRCARGYGGRLCGQCLPGFYRLNGRCNKCDNRTGPLLAIAAVLAQAAVCALLYFNLRTAVSYRFAAGVISLTSLQIMTTYSQLELAWPPEARAVLDALSIFSFNVEVSSPECASAGLDPFLLKFALTLALPAVMLVPFGLAIGIALLYAKLVDVNFLGVTLSPEQLLRSFRRSYIQVCSVLYLPVSAAAMIYFNCQPGRDGRYIMVAAPSKLCYTPSYWRLWYCAFFFSILYGVGMPAAVSAALIRARRRAANGDAAQRFDYEVDYAFLIRRFRESHYLFEIAVMLRKLSVVIAMVSFRTPSTKAAVAIVLLLLFLLHMTATSPYRERHHNWIDRLGLGSCITVLWGTTLKTRTGRVVVILGALILNLLFLAAGIVVDWLWLRRTEAEAAAEFKSMLIGAEQVTMAAAAQNVFVGGEKGSRASLLVIGGTIGDDSPAAHNGGAMYLVEESDSALGYGDGSALVRFVAAQNGGGTFTSIDQDGRQRSPSQSFSHSGIEMDTYREDESLVPRPPPVPTAPIAKPPPPAPAPAPTETVESVAAAPAVVIEMIDVPPPPPSLPVAPRKPDPHRPLSVGPATLLESSEDEAVLMPIAPPKKPAQLGVPAGKPAPRIRPKPDPNRPLSTGPETLLESDDEDYANLVAVSAVPGLPPPPPGLPPPPPGLPPPGLPPPPPGPPQQ